MLRFKQYLDLQEAISRYQDYRSLSGQQSERNLVNAINDNAPFDINLNNTKYTIVSSKQLGGGNPEPKADISITTSTGKNIGISMKKPNFAFFENWMNEKKLRTLLSSVEIEGDEQDTLVSGLKNKASDISKSSTFKNEVKKEYDTMIGLIPSAEVDSIKSKMKTGNKFKITDLKITSADRKLISNSIITDSKFSSKGKLASSFKIPNVYVSLKELLGKNYNNFLKNIIGGTSDNKYPAEYIIVETIKKDINLKGIISSLESSVSVDDTVTKYANDSKVNLIFRLRPITITRASYSQTNLGKYKKGSQFYADDSIGVSWTVFVTKK